VITVAIVGAGFMGATHAQAYADLGERVRVKTVCDRTPERAGAVAAKVGARVVTDLETTLVDSEIDAVDICVPTSFHREVAERALSRGKHVLLEKPIALTVQDADAIVAAAEASGAILMVGLTLRFWPEYVELARRVEARQLGEPMSISAYRVSPPAAWNGWMSDPSRSGGVAVDLLVHDFDQMNRLLGDPQRVLARPVGGDQSAGPGVLCLVDYDRGYAVAEGTMMAPDSYRFSCGIRALCDRGIAEYNFTSPPTSGGGNIERSTDERKHGLSIFVSGQTPELLPSVIADPWQLEIEHFLDCVESLRHPQQGTPAQARAALTVSLAANRSLASGAIEPV
jgi:predicted dehydrogenase